MKKNLKIFVLILLIMLVGIGYDCYKNVNVENNDNETTSLLIHDGIFLNIPKELWITIDHEEFKPSHAMMYVENYIPIFHTWYNTLQSIITYYYKNDETSFSREIHIAECSEPYGTDEILKRNSENKKSRLHEIRKARGFTQQQLSDASGVSLRMIQLYEQKQNDISKAQVNVVISSSKALAAKNIKVPLSANYCWF